MIADFWHNAGHEDSGREAGAGHWGGAAHHLHLLLPHGLQCKLLHNICISAAANAVMLYSIMFKLILLQTSANKLLMMTTIDTLVVKQVLACGQLPSSKVRVDMFVGSMDCLGQVQ